MQYCTSVYSDASLSSTDYGLCRVLLMRGDVNASTLGDFTF